MCGCCRFAASRDLALEPVDVDAGAELDRHDLDDDVSAERGLGRREHARHPAAAELALDGVRRAEHRLQLVAEFHTAWTSPDDEMTRKP